jgi:pimeloyl-ACP methyl ester carboxylesterase
MMRELPNPLGGQRRLFPWRGHDVAYVQRGEGGPVVFGHAIHACAWSMEWRHVVPAMAVDHATYTLDFLGFGASARPPIDYTAALYVELLRDFLVEVVGRPAVLVGSSLGGTYAVAVAAEHPALARGVCAIGPAGVTRLTVPGGVAGAMVQGLLRTPGLGEALFSGLVSKRSIRFFLRDIYSDRSVMTDEVVDLYWDSARRPNARFAPSAFVGMRLNLDIRAALASMPCRFMLAWGEQAAQTPLREAAAVHALRPEAPLVVLPGGDLPHEESPERFVDALRTFIASL